MPRSINLTGKPGRNYDLDKLATTDTRLNSDEELVVQIWYWNPDGIDSYKEDEKKYNEHKLPNPPSPKIGQIWLSRWVRRDFKED